MTYTITYSDANLAAMTLCPAAITLNKTGTANGTISVSPGTGTTRTVTISNITGDGTLGITLAAKTATDQVNHTVPGAGPSATFLVDNTAPTVSISGPTASLTKEGPVTYTVTYNDLHFDHSMLAPSDVVLITTGTADASTITVSGTGNKRSVILSGITGDGTLGISLAADTALDQDGNSAPAAGPGTAFTVDNSGPQVTISAPSSLTTIAGPVSFTVTYADPRFKAIKLTAANVMLNRTGTANGTVSVLPLTAASRIVKISNIYGNGTLGISLPAGIAFDTLGNLSPASDPSATFQVSGSPVLTTSFSGVPASVKAGATVVFTINVANTGNQIATGVILREQLPMFGTFIPASSTAKWSDQGGGVFVLNLGTLGIGAIVHVKFAVTFSPATPANTTVQNAIALRDDLSPSTDLATSMVQILVTM